MHAARTPARPASLWAVFATFLRLGCTSFGGPVAHLNYFRSTFVERLRWLTPQAYADLVALCQFLPGPASSQVGIALGYQRAGLAGALAAWAGFTLPSALLMATLALLLDGHLDAAYLHGLKLVTLAVVAQAVWLMGRSYCPDVRRALLALACAALARYAGGMAGQLGALLLGAVAGLLLPTAPLATAHQPLSGPMRQRTGAALLLLLALLLLALPLAAALHPSPALRLFTAFFRSGALVFGGGHVVLPLLQAELVKPGLIDADTFLAGYGAAQAMPGPLFTVAAFLGAALPQAPNAWLGAALALCAIFLPAFLLVLGALPLWELLRSNRRAQAALRGVNAAVVGLLLAALYQPVWSSAVHRVSDAALAALALLALLSGRVPPWALVLLSVLLTALLR